MDMKETALMSILPSFADPILIRPLPLRERIQRALPQRVLLEQRRQHALRRPAYR